MPLKIVRYDITKIRCDAIVNPTDRYYSHSGGTDKAIHESAGPELYAACVKNGAIDVGEVSLTDAYGLPCKYVFHTVGPIWTGGDSNEKELLESCYRRSLELARENKLQSIAFPLISSGTYGYPKDSVLKVAMNVISEFLFENEMLVYIVVYDKTAYELSRRLFEDVSSYIDKNLIANETEICIPARPNPIDDRRRHRDSFNVHYPRIMDDDEADQENCAAFEDKGSNAFSNNSASASPYRPNKIKPELGALGLDKMIQNMDKGFSESLLYYIDKKGMTDVECYKRANVDRKTFSKIKCNPQYRPSKVTAVSFAIALRLDVEETQSFLRTAGLTLSNSNKFDVIIGYFIATGNYDINEINETLFKFDQVLLGC